MGDVELNQAKSRVTLDKTEFPKNCPLLHLVEKSELRHPFSPIVAIAGIVSITAIILYFGHLGINGKIALGGMFLVGFIVRGFVPMKFIK